MFLRNTGSAAIPLSGNLMSSSHLIPTSCQLKLFGLRWVNHAVLICVLRKAKTERRDYVWFSQPTFQILFICWWEAVWMECTDRLALVAAMCTFVTLSEKRGIVCSEHILVIAAVMEAAANTVTWISLDQWLDARAPDPALLRAFWELVKLLMWHPDSVKRRLSDESCKK